MNEISKISNNSVTVQAKYLALFQCLLIFQETLPNIYKIPIFLSSIILSFHRQLTLLINHFVHKC